jgi:hypothetical protein
MSALGHKRTLGLDRAMSALPRKRANGLDAQSRLPDGYAILKSVRPLMGGSEVGAAMWERIGTSRAGTRGYWRL